MNTVGDGGGREGDLAVDDHVAAALEGRDDDIDALRGGIERRGIGDVTDDDLRVGSDERVDAGRLGGVVLPAAADEEADLHVVLIDEVRCDAGAEEAGCACDEAGGHDVLAFESADAGSRLFEYRYAPVP
ncbi:hypothetical protein GCM10025867_01620 [Frondihabitans sucicola]|uniref:Uncharacterized protein n=1 Tax=Frondihabitans sucicola TaxID=1268041 RepID=A0ABM8GHU9_9MICO|nr:hypothetical protein GCM10025867_01620 [Frondihabitans sucicola]